MRSNKTILTAAGITSAVFALLAVIVWTRSTPEQFPAASGDSVSVEQVLAERVPSPALDATSGQAGPQRDAVATKVSGAVSQEVRIHVQDEGGIPIEGAHIGVYAAALRDASPDLAWIGESDRQGDCLLPAGRLVAGDLVVADKFPFISDHRALGAEALVTLVLRHRASAQVTVTDHLGRPLQGVRVTSSVQLPHAPALQQEADYPKGLQRSGKAAAVLSAVTNASGVASFDELACGQRIFHASYPGYAVGADRNHGYFVNLVPGERADVRLKMIPIFCAIVDPGQHRIAQTRWSMASHLAIPGLSTTDLQRCQEELSKRFPGMFCWVFLPSLDFDRTPGVKFALEIMAMDGTWSKHSISACPVLDLSESCVSKLHGISDRSMGGTLVIDGFDQMHRLGISFKALDSRETWYVGSRLQFDLPVGWYQFDIGDPMLRSALVPSGLTTFQINSGEEHRHRIRIDDGFALCSFRVLDDLNRPVRNYFLKLRPEGEGEWEVWSGTLSKFPDIVAVVREAASYELEVEARGYTNIHQRIVPKRSASDAFQCEDIIIVVRETLERY